MPQIESSAFLPEIRAYAQELDGYLLSIDDESEATWIRASFPDYGTRWTGADTRLGSRPRSAS